MGGGRFGSVFAWAKTFWGSVFKSPTSDKPSAGNPADQCEPTKDDDLIVGWQFVATLQLRTPLSVLERDGEIVKCPKPPTIDPGDLWKYIWVPKLRTLAEILGIPDLPEFTNGSRASEIGYVENNGGEFLQFLLKMRKIVECPEEMHDREAALKTELGRPRWAAIVERLGGANSAKLKSLKKGRDT